MHSTVLPIYFDRRESLRGTLLVSISLHAVLFVAAFAYTTVQGRAGRGWGRSWGTGGATRVGAVSSLPGVPLPAPLQPTRGTLATQNPGLYKTEPKQEPEQAPPAKEEEIPKFAKAVKPEKAIRVAKSLQKDVPPPPDHAIPFGLGGKPAVAYAQFANPAGEGGLNFGEGAFGERYGWYVAAVRNRISANWLLATISPNIVTAPRIYINFDVLRDGTIDNVEIAQSSGIPEVDRSALRAVLASNPLGPLPADYARSKVSVEFYFDFRRR